jgi:oligosaccharide reducing-end xylanase
LILRTRRSHRLCSRMVASAKQPESCRPLSCFRKVVPVTTRICLSLFAFAVSLTWAYAASAQVPAASPSQPQPTYKPPLPHVNAPLGDIPSMPGDGHGAYQTHQYRDLFAENGHAPTESKAKIDKAFQQLFHGDGQEERLYFETGANANGPLAYITDWANNDARTEGMSYGMMIAVELDKKREFDALWNWANTYMLITNPQNPSVGYFAWSMSTDGRPRSTGAAPDGEEYFTLALHFAAHRWGGGHL